MISEVEKCCTKFLVEGKCTQQPFHNIEHSKEVISSVKVISNCLRFTKEKIEAVLITALFHDTVFSKKYVAHKDSSKSLAKEKL